MKHTGTSSNKNFLAITNSSNTFQSKRKNCKIISEYSRYLSLQQIKHSFEFTSIVPSASSRDINKIIKLLSVNKTKVPECIFTKYIKILVNVFDCRLANIIDNDAP